RVLLSTPTMTPQSVRELGERMRHAITTTEPPVTASIGIAVTTARTLPHSAAVDAALSCADAAMYRAKRCGGDTVAVDTCTTFIEHDRRLKGPASPQTGTKPWQSAPAVGRSPSPHAGGRGTHTVFKPG
ncbi:hypothetical protein KIH27_21535, partial [Mycobacterium sp. M1]|nr:hypothetical protein [Mycolicibacter acidiphilus]